MFYYEWRTLFFISHYDNFITRNYIHGICGVGCSNYPYQLHENAIVLVKLIHEYYMMIVINTIQW